MMRLCCRVKEKRVRGRRRRRGGGHKALPLTLIHCWAAQSSCPHPSCPHTSHTSRRGPLCSLSHEQGCSIRRLWGGLMVVGGGGGVGASRVGTRQAQTTQHPSTPQASTLSSCSNSIVRVSSVRERMGGQGLNHLDFKTLPLALPTPLVLFLVLVLVIEVGDVSFLSV